MDSSKIVNVDRQSEVNLTDINLTALRAESLANIDRLQASLNDRLSLDIGEIQEQLSRSFRQFLLAKEQERMPFLQRVMTSHIENMEDERGFPPRHPVHWFKSKLEFSSTGVLQFDVKKDAEAFMESALSHIEAEIKEQLAVRQQATLATINSHIQELQQSLATQLQGIAKARKIISTEYVNSFIQTDRLSLKAIDRFYFVSMGARFNPKQELIYSEVCVRPTGIFVGKASLKENSRKDSNNPTQLKYAISCDRLLDVVNESIDRSIGQIKQQSQVYLTGELAIQIDKLLQGLVS
jgi:polyhydroxyalkanoate synthesis regulator phasin